MSKQDYDAFRNQINPIETLVDWASSVYERKRKENGLSTGDGDCWEGEISELEDDCVITEWEYNWQYGGHSDGQCVIPLDAILGDEQSRLNFIQSVIDIEVQKRDEKDLSHRVQENKRKLETYNRLKKEFGDV